VKKTICHPFPGVSANGVTVYHAVTPAHLAHVSVIILYYGWFQELG